MYEQLIKQLRGCADAFFCTSDCPKNPDTNCQEQLMKEAADAIEALSKKEKTTQWIPVTERLPELAFVTEWYLVALESGCVESLGYTKGKGWFSTGSPVTHWMPLPEPPKEETE